MLFLILPLFYAHFVAKKKNLNHSLTTSEALFSYAKIVLSLLAMLYKILNKAYVMSSTTIVF